MGPKQQNVHKPIATRGSNNSALKVSKKRSSIKSKASGFESDDLNRDILSFGQAQKFANNNKTNSILGIQN